MKKNVLIVYAKGTPELLNRQSALGSYIFCLGALLNKNGFNVFINEFSLTDLHSHTVAGQNLSKGTVWWKKLFPRFIKEFKRRRALSAMHAELAGKINRSQIYHLIMEFYTFNSSLGLKLSEEFKCPLVTVFDSPVLEEYRFFNGNLVAGSVEIEKKQNETLSHSKQIVVYSGPVKNYVAKITGKEQVIHIHQNVDFTRFDFIEPRKPKGEIQIGFIGSFLKWHRVDLLIHVFERLKKQGLNARLWLVGNGMEWNNIEKRVNLSPHRESIELTGFCDGNKLLDIKKKLHIGVMPGSNWYGAPNKIFEYGAAGLAVMAPATPTIRDLFNNGEVMLFEQDNEDKAYGCLYKLVNELDVLAKYQNKLHAKIKNDYGQEKTLTFYTELLNRAMES